VLSPTLLSPESSLATVAGPGAALGLARHGTRDTCGASASLRRTLSLEGTFAEDPAFLLAKRVGGARGGGGLDGTVWLRLVLLIAAALTLLWVV
jgi:hypothetical protein